MCHQISSIGRSQRQIMHQLDNLNNLLRGSLGEKSHPTRTNSRKSIDMSSDSVGARVMVVAAVGCLGIFLMKVLLNKKWFIPLGIVSFLGSKIFFFTVTTLLLRKVLRHCQLKIDSGDSHFRIIWGSVRGWCSLEILSLRGLITLLSQFYAIFNTTKQQK